MRTTILSILLIVSIAAVGGSEAKPRCGRGLPACSNNRCCSADGYCGAGVNFCRLGCQTEFGRCRKPPRVPDAPPPVETPPPSNQRPERPRGGGPAKIIYSCTVPGTVAITFDDGPAKRTPELLDVLARYPDVRVTFFVNGNNYVNAALPEYQAIIARAFNSGHQIASHTFQHKDLATLSDTDIQDQMISNDDVIYSATGRVPRYMRPPYGSTDADSLAALGALGYVVTNWGVDTRDWADNDAEKSADEFEKALAKGPSNTFIALAHDTVESTAADLMDLVIPLIRQSNLRMVTIAECLGDSHPYL